MNYELGIMNYELGIRIFFRRRRKKLTPNPYTLNPNKGFGLIEILVAAAIVGVAFTTLSGAVLSAFRVTDDDVLRIQAAFLAEEGLEIVRFLRDAGWEENIAGRESGTSYYPVFLAVENAWTLAAEDPGPVDGIFSREIIFEEVYRRTSDDDIVLVSDGAPKALDTGTVRATSRVTWAGRTGAGATELSSYFTAIFGD